MNIMVLRNRIVSIIIVLVSLNIALIAQNNPDNPEPSLQGSSSKPLELPNFIIQGKEQLNVKSGIKKLPKKPLPMTKVELDSLNSLEKQQSLILPPESLPDKIIYSEFQKGYLFFDAGRYASASLEAGYEYNRDDYSLFGNAGIDYYGGHVNNSNYNKLDLNLFLDYNAPDKFFIFGGSKTRTSIKFKQTDYFLYAKENAPNRNAMDFDLNITSNGSYAGYEFSTGAGFKSLQLMQNSSDKNKQYSFDNSLTGFVNIKNKGHDYELGGKAQIEMESVRGNGMQFFEIAAFGTYVMGKTLINFEAGFQAGVSSIDVGRAGLLVDVSITHRLSNLFTTKAAVSTGLKKVSYSEQMLYNPYMNFLSESDYSYEMPMIKAFLYYHPDENIGLSCGIKFGSIDRSPVYDSISDGMFLLHYEKINEIELITEGFYQITDFDKLSFNGIINYSVLSSNSNLAPFQSPISISINYLRNWYDNKFGTEFGIVYIAKRYADVENVNELEAYIDLRIKADYKITEFFVVSANINNLTNSNIYIWQGYKERGLFFNLGLLYNF